MLTSHAELHLKSCCRKSKKHRTFDGNATRKCISIPGTQKSTAIPVFRALFDDMVFGDLQGVELFWGDLDETTFRTQNWSSRRAVGTSLLGPLGRWEFYPYDQGNGKILLCVNILGRNCVVV